MTIKMLHFADVHIGMENYGRTHPETGLSTRVMDFVHRMDDMIDFAAQNDVDIAVFAGDAFKTRNPNPTYQREFAHRVQDLANLCPIVLLLGNHDLPTNADRASTVEIYETLHVPNVYVGMDYELREIETKSGSVQIATAPYPVRSRLMKDVPGGLSISQLDALLQESVEAEITTLANIADQSDAPRVLAGHFTVSGAVTGSERQVMLGRDVAVLLSAIANPIWDYVALGHIHKFQDLTRGNPHQPPVVYSGSLERIDFGEEGDDKGFCWVELERGHTRYEFITLPTVRPFVTLRIDVRRSTRPLDLILAEIDRHDVLDAVVRVMITSDLESDALIRNKVIEDELRDRGVSAIAAISRDVERPIRARLGTNPEGLRPPELLQKYLESRDIDPATIERLLEAAEPIFRAVEES